MARTRTILPPSSTPLERVIDTTFPNGWGAMVDAMDPLAMADNDTVLPWVAQQWQLARIDRYFGDTRELLAQGLPWLRERGTAAGVRRVLSWLGYSGVTFDEDGPYLHINPGREVSNADIKEMAYAVRATIPLHVSFYRVFYRYDLRMLRWDRKPKWDSAIWDNVSGTLVDVGDGGPPVIGSQARFTISIVEAPNLSPLQEATALHYASSVRRADVMRWDVWRWDGVMVRPLMGAQISAVAVQVTQYIPLPPESVDSQGMAAVVNEAREAQLTGMQETAYASECTPRMPQDSKWTGRWDARPWRSTNIDSNHYETTE